MGHQHTFIEVQNRLLKLYRGVGKQAAPAQDQIRTELSKVRDLVRTSGSNGTLDTYHRFLDLMSIRVPGLAQDASLRLTKADLRTPSIERPRQVITQSAGKGVAAKPARLGPIAQKGIPGISLVTCCMNRNENLLKALPSWLQHQEINEVVIVDWSSDTPVSDELTRSGIRDSRIRVVRVDGEPRWILSYAFNVGFRIAQYDQILKVDADIVVAKDFFARNVLQEGHFIAGNWRKAAANQAYVNGFFFAPRAALHAVGGFNEFISTYGWDDDDIYHRMMLAGFHRSDVADGCIHHLDHSDEERLGAPAHETSAKSAADVIMAETGYKIRRNRYIANVMPYWKDNSTQVGFDMIVSGGEDVRLVRDAWVPSALPPHVDRQADFIALWENASWRLGPRIRMLEEPALRQLLKKPLEAITPLDIELAIFTPDKACALAAPYCVLRIPDLPLALKNEHSAKRVQRALAALASRGNTVGVQLVVQSPLSFWPGGISDSIRAIPLLPSWVKIGNVPPGCLDELLSGKAQPAETALIEMRACDVCGQFATTPPSVMIARHKFYIDVQHGLGNRLRAIGSAAAIAEATDRELVIVWQPDDHCDCRFSDLFDYEGAVIEESFIQNADHCDIHNYMAIEGGEKNALIRSEQMGDIYARSAFVLNSPHSDWARENRFIRSLTPVEAVLQLVNSVRQPNDVAAHVRMEGGRKDQHLPYESTSNWTEQDHDLIDHWRSKSHFSHFMARIDVLIKEGKADRIFIAADRPETYDEFRLAYSDRLAWLERSLFDRSAEQLQYALADAILLSRTPLLLGSTWSSFSELAQRLSHGKLTVEMSGKHF